MAANHVPMPSNSSTKVIPLFGGYNGMGCVNDDGISGMTDIVEPRERKMSSHLRNNFA